MFCGPGGLSKGAFLASEMHDKISIEHGWATDIDVDACKTYAYNICGDINSKSVYPDDIREPLHFIIKKLPPVDLLTFGFPCNDFSIVGEKLGIQGKYGPLYSYCVNALKILKPTVFVGENVGGITSSNQGQTFKVILNAFIDAGYRLTVNKFKFENYGVPQKRHRIVIVGFRNDTPYKFEVPAEFDSPAMTAKNALEIPLINGATNNELTKNTQKVIDRLSWIDEGKNIWHAMEKPDFPDQLRLNVKGAKLSQIYRRLHSNEPAYTITGSGGGGTHVYHWEENRALTNRERARLQTFPDDYVFYGGKESVRKQIGMAVPVQGAKVIFNAILNCILGKEYAYQPPSIGYFMK